MGLRALTTTARSTGSYSQVLCREVTLQNVLFQVVFSGGSLEDGYGVTRLVLEELISAIQRSLRSRQRSKEKLDREESQKQEWKDSRRKVQVNSVK